MVKDSIEILGAYGGRASRKGGISILLDEKNVIDAGNLLEPLGEESIHIEHIWLTHAHLDHIVDIAYILDEFYTIRTQSLVVHGLQETLQTLQTHFFNDKIWPDFTKIPLQATNEATLKYETIEYDKKYSIDNKSYIEVIYCDHIVACCGFVYYTTEKGILIAGDTGSVSHIVTKLEQEKKINSCIVECSFPNSMEKVALASKHLTPNLLEQGLKKLQREDVSFYINHIKPRFEKKIEDEIKENRAKIGFKLLKDKEIVNF